MYHANDPRASLVKTGAKPGSSGHFSPASYARFYNDPPQITAANEKTWIARGSNFIVAYSEVTPGACLERLDQNDEYCLILPDKKGSATISASGETINLPGFSIAFIPPGHSRIEIQEAGRLIRIFSASSPDLVDICSNKAEFLSSRPPVPAFKAWPEPFQRKIHHYSLDVQGQKERFGRIFRCSTVMINFLDPRIGLRDVTMLSPHHHDDFEQGSLVLDGAYIHDIRWPWIPDMNAWRQDEHELMAAPSLTVIPPPTVHTSRSVLPGFNQMIDIFSPPRFDFSAKPGWVLNAADYPMPDSLT